MTKRPEPSSWFLLKVNSKRNVTQELESRGLVLGIDAGPRNIWVKAEEADLQDIDDVIHIHMSNIEDAHQINSGI
jgi:hypothetical protein